MPEILKGKPVADRNKHYCLETIDKYKLKPHLQVILVGDDPASAFYVDSIKKQSTKYNINLAINNENDLTENQLIDIITKLNNDPNTHGIMVQKPLPKHLNAGTIENTISPDKDIDGFHALNAGLMLYEKDCFLPCTAQAILEIMDFYSISAEGKHVVVVGRSNVVGKPIANLLLYKSKNRNATVTICHSRTPDLSVFTKQADILITAVGVANLVKGEMIKEGVVIIDAGINELHSQNSSSLLIFVGDVDFDSCLPKCSAITPVPGGVGSVTTSILFKHLCDSAKKF
jgi:methylenetetrahydrofolate dehydrogenase (NADP+)/methenyltetrahydrofolate cyclohydrolase